MDELKARLERHRFHIRKLETLLRMLDNMSVEVQQVRSWKFIVFIGYCLLLCMYIIFLFLKKKCFVVQGSHSPAEPGK